MTINRGLFVKQNGDEGTTPIDARRALAGLFAENAPGAPRTGLLEPATTSVVTGTANMSYNVSAFQAVVQRAATEGVYLFSGTGVTNVPTTAAPGTDKRYDLIWIKQNDIEKSDVLGGVVDNSAIVGVVQGSVAAAPAKPYVGVPDGAYVIAEALVSAGSTATNQGTVTISQTWRYAALKGAPIWVRGTTERAEITPYVGLRVHRLDNGLYERWNGTTWVAEADTLNFALFTTVQGSVPSGAVWGPGMPSKDVARSINADFVTFSENDWLSVNRPGIYTIDLMVEMVGGFGPGGFVFMENLQANTIATVGGSGGNPGGLSTSVTLFLNPGTTFPAGVVKLGYYQNGGTARQASVRINVAKVM